MVKLILINQVKKNECRCVRTRTKKYTNHKLYIFNGVNVKVYFYLIEHHTLYAVTKQLSKFSRNYRFATTLGNNNNNKTIRSANILHSM